MKLIIKLDRDLPVVGGTGFVLCTEDGELFGPQISCTIQTDTGNAPLVTFTFRVDGENVRFAD